MNNRRLRKTRLHRSCTSIKPAQIRIRTLRKLVPTSGSWSTGGLDGLFKEAADYIVSLQIRVKAMQVMVPFLPLLFFVCGCTNEEKGWKSFVAIWYFWSISVGFTEVLLLQLLHTLNAFAAMAATDVEVVEVERPTKQTRRSWRKTEEDALMKCMLSEEAERWKAENGFKTGYFTHLEKELRKVIPGCTLKAHPHIDSKVRYWKSLWAKIVDITNLSGFGWDNVNKRIDVEQTVWDAYEKAHPQKVKNLYGKSFPYFDDWCVLFGKDRATGAAAEDYDEMARPDIPEEFSEPHNSIDFYDAMFENYDQHLPNTPTTPVTPTPHPSLPTSTPRGSTPAANAGVPNKRKRTRMGDAELSIHASMDSFFKSSCSYMDKMANSFGYDKELSARRTMVKDELSKLDITLTEKFKLSAIIVQAEERVDDFYGTKPEERQAFVEAILAGEVYGPI
ncbi:hypothetical protein RHMOL_Rhmol01G0385600 [Rhododendron molle]|uniref:Uncharacterized protein n=1 Tax=Rhododendron molle TaxID=49168 RepID=A0ACC0Q9Z4_RHOML|nr:hypothetical protein RHMOL_Rhmol01G0385600 [Rhododendron molle]